MKKTFLLYTLALTILFGCKTFQNDDSELPAADQSVTIDCPDNNSDAKIFLSRSENSGIENVNSIQISRIETEMISGSKLAVKTYFQALDENNNFITDLNDKFLCEIIDSSNYKRIPIKDYTITKKTTKDRVPVYLTLVLDHSGSMGDARAESMQNAILEFIKNTLQSEDKLMIVKFDSKNNAVSVPVSSGTDFENFKVGFANKLEGYGTATALYDAIETGMSEMEYNATGDYAKSLVVLTDGYENSSKVISAGADLVNLARKANISINTVGYASNVDKLLLADTLAMQTGGIFQHICNTNDLKLVFEDIYYRLKNYYLLEYSTINYPGAHFVKLSLCDKKARIQAENLYLHPGVEKELPIPIDVYFDFAKATLKQPDSKVAIDIMDTLLRNDPMMKIEIQGHTDSIGTEKANQQLSENRAKSVMNALIAKGIDKSRISAVGYGETKPIADNSTEEGRAANRRVVFVIKSSSVTVKRTEPYYKSPFMTSTKKR